MSHNDEIPERELIYPAELHPNVVGECRSAWANNRPWTKLRVLEKGVDTSEIGPCALCQGEIESCEGKIEAIQYNSVFGNPLWYCENHALKQSEWDVIHYYSKPKPVPDLTPQQKVSIEKILSKRKKKEKPENEKDDS